MMTGQCLLEIMKTLLVNMNSNKTQSHPLTMIYLSNKYFSKHNFNILLSYVDFEVLSKKSWNCISDIQQLLKLGNG